MIFALLLSIFALAVVSEIVLQKWGMNAHLLSIGVSVFILYLILLSYRN